MKKILFIIVFFAGVSICAHSADIKFTWNANTEEDLSGYKLHAGNTTGEYEQTVDVGNVTTYEWAGFDDGTWFFAATAYDEQGNESGYSNEVSFTVDTAAPGAPENLQATVTASEVIIKTVD